VIWATDLHKDFLDGLLEELLLLLELLLEQGQRLALLPDALRYLMRKREVGMQWPHLLYVKCSNKVMCVDCNGMTNAKS
jgi:hypothetical protein